MSLYMFDIGEKSRKAARFIGQVRAELQMALATEKASRKLTQQQIANLIGVNRSVINRQFMGLENLTLRRVAELAWALGWEIVFHLKKPQAQALVTAVPKFTASNASRPIPLTPVAAVQTGTDDGLRIAA